MRNVPRLQIIYTLEFNEYSMDLTPSDECDTLSEFAEYVKDAWEGGRLDIDNVLVLTDSVTTELKVLEGDIQK